MNLKRVGIIIILLGIAFTIYFMDNWDYLVLGLTFAIFGFLITIMAILIDIKKQKVINDRLESDIDTVIQPIITKYANRNRHYIETCSKEEYVQNRAQLNSDLEKELGEKLPYLSKMDIKKIVIEFSRNQESQ